MWTLAKELLNTVELVIIHKHSDIYAELDEVLTKCKSLFLSPLKNKEKESGERERIKKAHEVGVEIARHSSAVKLNDALIKDALLLSDHLNLNEFSCAELLVLAEQQMPNFPAFSRILVASILYHDGRKCVLSALKLLLTARPGVTWMLELDERITELVEEFTQQLLDDGLVGKLIQLLQEISLPEELKKLESAQALSDGKHKKTITELVEEQQLLIADCLFSVARQNPLPKTDCVALLNHLKTVKPNTLDGSLDVVTTRALLALAACFNCEVMDAAVENIEDEKHKFDQLPYFKDKSFLTQLHQSLVRPDIQVWQTPGIKFTLQFCWSVFLRTCAAHPKIVEFTDVCEEDESLLEMAVEGDVFQFMRTALLTSANFHEEEYFLKTVHSFITSFITKFPLKMKDLRNQDDENARILMAHAYERMQPPQGLRQDFKEFMLLLSALYSKDPLDLQLCSEYWVPPEPLGGVFTPQPLGKLQQAVDHRKLMLNKFVRHAGDVLLPPLYVPYMNMLIALSGNEQAASYCFRLVASTGAGERSGYCTVSWDHLFLSIKQYYLNLRTINDSADHRHHKKQDISPEELEGLESVIKLIHVVADKNENVRVAFCENQTWLPVASLFGLVCCSIPAKLKGMLLKTLSAFAKTPEIAASLWQSLEASQILQTHKSSTAKSDIAIELQEIESRNETYPETRGFIELLNQLTNIPIPSTLGAGQRIPGFEPYLSFLVNDVFLKLRTRAYNDNTEKWQVCSEVLQLFAKILREYEPHPDHFVDHNIEIQGVIFGKASKPPGYKLLTLLLNDTPVLRMLLAVVDDAFQQLATILSNNPLKSILEAAVEPCMSILNTVLEKQDAFTDYIRNSDVSQLVSSLDDLLLSMNVRTGYPDYLFILSKYLTIHNLKSSITLNIVVILKKVCQGTQVQKEIVETLLKDEKVARELLVGFSEHLETISPETEVDELNHETEIDATELIRQEIVNLLIITVNQPSRNMAQFLLGYEMHLPISETNLQDPGVRGFPKTCFHSIIDILNRSASMCETVPKFVESLYHLLFLLCSHQEMGVPTRRYLRAGFFVNHVGILTTIDESNEMQFIRQANQQAWLLKALAIEIKVASASRARSTLQKLLNALFNIQDNNATTSFINAPSLKSDNLATTLLASLSFTQRYPPNIVLNFFDYNAVEQLLVSCEETDNSGAALCNIKKLYKIMLNEINSSQIATGLAQKQEILTEVKAILKHAVERNVTRESFFAKSHLYDAWRHVVELVFCVCGDVIPVDDKYTIIINLLKILVEKLNDNESLPELVPPISATILCLMANLAFIFTQNPVNHVSMMAGVSKIFPSMVQGVINARQSSMRTNLYGAFLYYVQMGLSQTSVTKEGVEDVVFQTKEDWSTSSLRELSKHGDTVLEIVAKDTCQGTCISKMMAMSLLDAVASLDWQVSYLRLMTSRGYLKVLVNQITQDDAALLNVLSLQPDTMKPLYIFQSRMALLTKIGCSDAGAQSLLQVSLLLRLSECQFLDLYIDRPTMMANQTTSFSDNDPFMPSLVERYSSIFTSFLRLLLAMISSLGVKHRVAIQQMQSLIMNHEDVFLNTISSCTDNLSSSSLKQLSLVLSIVSVLPMQHDDSEVETWSSLTDEQRHWRMFMNKVLSLVFVLQRNFHATSLEKQVQLVLDSNGQGKFSQIRVEHLEVENTLLSIRSRIFTFCKNIVSSKALSGPQTTILYSPSFDHIVSQEARFVTGKPVNYKDLPSLHVLLNELKTCPLQMQKCLKATNVLERRLQSLHEMAYDEMNEILSQTRNIENLPHHQRQVIVKKTLEKVIILRNQQADCLSGIMEHVLYTLWRHLEYFLIHCIPSNEIDDSNRSLSISRMRNFTDEPYNRSIANLTERSSMCLDRVSKENIEKLKEDAKTLLTDKLWTDILESDKIHGREISRLAFVSSLVRRVQSLVKLNS